MLVTLIDSSNLTAPPVVEGKMSAPYQFQTLSLSNALSDTYFLVVYKFLTLKNVKMSFNEIKTKVKFNKRNEVSILHKVKIN